MGDFDNYGYFYCYGCDCGYASTAGRLSREAIALTNEKNCLKTELDMLKKAYAELAESKSKLEAENDRLGNYIMDRDAVITFLWDKVIK